MFLFSKLSLESTLPPEEIARRLQSQLAERSILGGGGELVGTVRDGKLKIWVQIGYRNSFNPIYEGRIEPIVTGTRIVGRFRMHYAVVLFLVFWFGSTIPPLYKDPGSALGRSFDIVFPLFGLALFVFGYFFSAKEIRTIRGYLNIVIDPQVPTN